MDSPGTIITDDITTNTTWSISGSPYIINTNNITVTIGATLTIEPGVEIRLANYSLIVYGKIIAIGTEVDSIKFTSNLENPNPLDWDRILIQGSNSDSSEFKYCKIQYGRVGVTFKKTLSKISRSIIEYCDRSGIEIDSCSSTIDYNTIRNIVHEGVHIPSASPIVNGNKIYSNTNGITTDYASSIIQNNVIYNNSIYGIDNRNANDADAIASIINNTVDNNGSNNINCDNSSPIIKNNIITNCSGDGGIRATSGGTPINTYNNVWNNRIDYWSTGGNSQPGEGSISEDPKFLSVATYNYHLLDDSPCIRAATQIDCPINDIDGIQRGNPPDMGAYENISYGDQSLPVELVSFEAQYSNHSVILMWLTSSETNNLGFELFKKEIHENNFKLCASFMSNNKLKGSGTSYEPRSYKFIDTSVQLGTTYEYKLVQVDFSGYRKEFPSINIKINSIKETMIPNSLTLFHNYPNPFNYETTIKYFIPNPGSVKIKIFNSSGQLVKKITNYYSNSGLYEFTWDATDIIGNFVSSGIYVCNIAMAGKILSIKLMYLK